MTEKKISDYLPKTEILAQLAEEASELAQAALKLRRALDGKNPTPKSVEECEANLLEETADVKVAMEAYVWNVKPCVRSRVYEEIVKTAHVKFDRWLSRLQAQEDAVKLEKECGKGVFDVTIHCENEQEMDEAVALLNLANRMHWRKTAEDPPKAEDADPRSETVLTVQVGIGFVTAWEWQIVADFPEEFPIWMPLPELQEEKCS